MGSLRGEDGDGRQPPDNQPSDQGGLPDLPPDWGIVVVPDDLTELDREAAVLRREHRREVRRAKWRKRFGLSPKPDRDSPPVGVPLLIMCIAIVAALTSLFAITFSTRAGPSPTQTTSPPAANPPSQLVNVQLPDGSGGYVWLEEKLPAAILLLDGCSCQSLIEQTAAAAPSGVTVIAVDRTIPFVPVGVNAIGLEDPEQALLATYGDGPDRAATPAGQPTALLVASDGSIRGVISPVDSVSSFQTELSKLS